MVLNSGDHGGAALIGTMGCEARIVERWITRRLVHVIMIGVPRGCCLLDGHDHVSVDYIISVGIVMGIQIPWAVGAMH